MADEKKGKKSTVADKQAPAAKPVTQVSAPRINTSEMMTAKKAKAEGLDGFLFGKAGEPEPKAKKAPAK